MDYEKIGSFIKQLRSEKKLTQKELANKINVTDKAISKWERGLGCPDVSLLEDLAKELDVSILELLKGERIDNINIDDANKLVKEGAIYSKNKYKDRIINSINYIILGIVICIILFISILNIIHYRYLNEVHVYDISDRSKWYKEEIDKIESNIEYIRNNQGKYSDEDYKEIIDSLDNCFNNLKNWKLYKAQYNNGVIKYKINEIATYTYYSDINQYKSMSSIFEVLNKYNNKDYSNYLNMINRTHFFSLNAHDDYYYSHKYRLFIHERPSDPDWEMNVTLNNNWHLLIHDTYNLLVLTDEIKEVGEYNE